MGPFALLALFGLGLGMAAFIGGEDDGQEDNAAVVGEDDQEETADVVNEDDEVEDTDVVNEDDETIDAIIVNNGVSLQGTDGADVFQIPEGTAEALFDPEFSYEDPSGFTNVSLDAGGGNDTIDLNDGELDGEHNDFLLFRSTISGGAGDDVIEASIGNSLLDGGSGNDTIDSPDGQGGTITGGTGDDLLHGSNSHGDHLYIEGGEGNDTLSGGGLSVFLRGGEGDDVIVYGGNNISNEINGTHGYGGAGDDTLRIDVSPVDPTVQFGFSITSATGGGGSDVFEINLHQFSTGNGISSDQPEPDTVVLDGYNINDFEPGIDRLEVDVVDLNDGFLLANARLDNSDTTEALLILRYESDDFTDREVVISMNTTSNVQWSDVTFVGDNIPTLLPLI